MDLSAFKAALAASVPPAGIARPLQALWHEARGDWQRAHELVQADNGKAAARVHAYLHRREGDLANANYWHERAGKTMPEITEEREWEMLVEALLTQGD